MIDVPLREYLERLIHEGDQRLESHVTTQIQQVREPYLHVQTALVSADKLEVARLANLERQITLQLAARDVAIDKAEQAAEKRFESVNEFRGQMNDQQATFLPREVFETQMVEMGKKIDAATRRLDEIAGQSAGSRSATAMMITVAVVVIMLASFAANYATTR